MKRETYPTDLSGKQFPLLETMLPPPERLGRKRTVNLRRIFNAQVISESVRLLEAKEKGTEALRREIMRGFEDVQNGRFTIISGD